MTKTTKTFAPVVLKTLVGDIIKANPTSTLTEKKARVKLRENIKAHERNQSWVFNTQAQYDAARVLFDAAYAAKIAKPAKVRKPKTPKADAPAPEAPAE